MTAAPATTTIHRAGARRQVPLPRAAGFATYQLVDPGSVPSWTAGWAGRG